MSLKLETAHEKKFIKSFELAIMETETSNSTLTAFPC